jgi:hypothetical protein
VDPGIVATTVAFFPPAVVEAAWRDSRDVLSPTAAAEAYAECCRVWGRAHVAAADGLEELCALGERVIAAADSAGLPLFAGWRALPLPDEAPARASQILNVLREHRGGLHIAAVLASGLRPLEAKISDVGGADAARFYGWLDPLPEPSAEMSARRERAESLTDQLAARAYEVLDAEELSTWVRLCDNVKLAAKTATAKG